MRRPLPSNLQGADMLSWLKKWQEKRLLKKIKQYQLLRNHNQVTQEQINHEIKLLHMLSDFYHKNRKKKYYPYALQMQENAFRLAAQLGDVGSQLWLGQNLLNHARAREACQPAEVLANADNQKKMDDLYFQAHVYLEQAAKSSVEAQRMLGLCSIHGWGKPMDRKKGFSLIVESINREDSWDKLPEIFSKIGLNKPEFLKELIKFRTEGA